MFKNLVTNSLSSQIPAVVITWQVPDPRAENPFLLLWCFDYLDSCVLFGFSFFTHFNVCFFPLYLPKPNQINQVFLMFLHV